MSIVYSGIKRKLRSFMNHNIFLLSFNNYGVFPNHMYRIRKETRENLSCSLICSCIVGPSPPSTRDTNGTNGFDNTALFTVVSDDDVFPETDCQLRAPDYLGIVGVRLNISHNDGLCLHPVLANINQHHQHHHHCLTFQSSLGAISLSELFAQISCYI